VGQCLDAELEHLPLQLQHLVLATPPSQLERVAARRTAAVVVLDGGLEHDDPGEQTEDLVRGSRVTGAGSRATRYRSGAEGGIDGLGTAGRPLLGRERGHGGSS
jgi:hypothetical protein